MLVRDFSQYRRQDCAIVGTKFQISMANSDVQRGDVLNTSLTGFCFNALKHFWLKISGNHNPFRTNSYCQWDGYTTRPAARVKHLHSFIKLQTTQDIARLVGPCKRVVEFNHPSKPRRAWQRSATR